MGDAATGGLSSSRSTTPRASGLSAAWASTSRSNSAYQEERETTIEFLRLVSQSTGTRNLVRAATTFFQQQSGCQAVGVRLKEGDDYPYFEARGFPAEFVLVENSLCARDRAGAVQRDSAGYPILECMCGNVICGRFDASQPFFTAQGSFWTNCTTELLATSSEAGRLARTRNRCNAAGYESVALIPLHVGEDRLGLLQLNDRRKGRFSPATIALWERLAGHLAVALAKFRSEERLKRAKLAAEAANRAKSEFLANMSHEIRTPMTAILGFSDLLTTPDLPLEEQREFLAGIQRNGKALLELIGDILDLSRIEAQKLTLAKTDCSLQQIIDDALSVVKVRARKTRGCVWRSTTNFRCPKRSTPIRFASARSS